MVCPVWRPCDPTVPPRHPSRSPAGPGTRAGGAITPLVTQQAPAAEFWGLSVAVLGPDCRFGAIWRRMAARGPCLERQGPMSRCPVPSRPLRIVRAGGEGPSPPSRWSSLAPSGARFAWCARLGAHMTLVYPHDTRVGRFWGRQRVQRVALLPWWLNNPSRQSVGACWWLSWAQIAVSGLFWGRFATHGRPRAMP